METELTTERTWKIRGGDFAQASAARREFARYLNARGAADEDCQDAALVFGELVTNAVKNARSYASVELMKDGYAALRVVDDGRCFEHAEIAPQPVYAQSGRGLYIASQLARELNVVQTRRGCEVTAVLPLRV